jgi:flagellar basal-body rod protein FlgG
MNQAFYVAAIGMEAQQRALDTIANNISNVNTPAFKRSDLRFSEIVAGQADRNAPTAALDAEAFEPAGVMATAFTTINQVGRVEATGNKLDVAIDGDGFIEVMGPEGQTLLWRGGTLQIGEDGLLGIAGGRSLRAAITVPVDAARIEIGGDGVVRAITGEKEPTEIGQIMLVKTNDATRLQRLDGGLYKVDDGATLADARPGEDGTGMLVQGSLEHSNVELTSEMVQLMMVQRAYGANGQIVQSADQLMGIAKGLRR